jgi:hypothetical protein
MSGAGEPDVSLDKHGMSLTMVLCNDGCPASRTHKST